MLLGHIHTPNTYEPFLQHSIWQKALTWLANKAETLKDGEHEIDNRNMYASISTAQTMPREEAVYEAHRQYIDIHYCLEGGEIIEWAPVNQLTPKMEFDTTKDYCLYESPKEANSLVIKPGTFAIFLPGDAHMPKISDGHNQQIRKVVVKIHTKLLA